MPNIQGINAAPSSISGVREALGVNLSDSDRAEVNQSNTGDSTGSHTHTSDPVLESFNNAHKRESDTTPSFNTNAANSKPFWAHSSKKEDPDEQYKGWLYHTLVA